MKHVLYDIIEDEIMIFERRGFLGFNYCLTDGGRRHPGSGYASCEIRNNFALEEIAKSFGELIASLPM